MTAPGGFDEVVTLLAAARGPEDVFGPRTAGRVGARRTYRMLAALVHPDCAPPGAADRATAAFQTLSGLYGRFLQAATGTGGTGDTGDAETTVDSGTRRYTLAGPPVAGDIANLYRARTGDPTQAAVLIKIVRSPANNDLMAGEEWALRTLARDGDERFRPYVPDLREAFVYRDPADRVGRRAHVLDLRRGFFSLAQVAAAFPDGLDPRDAAWMWRRLLVAVGHAHRAGVVHGAVLPEHVLIHPDSHGLVLAGWGCAVPPGHAVPAMVPHRAALYPPEVGAGRPAGPTTDIYLATRTMAELVGSRMPRPMRAFTDGCALAAPNMRPHDAWALLSEFDELLGDLYGPRRYRPFAMPGTATYR